MVFHHLSFSALPLLREISIGSGCFKKMECDLEICNFPNLETIKIQQSSFPNPNSFIIRNNDKLNSIEIGNNACQNISSLILESIYSMLILQLNLPNLHTFKTGDNVFQQTRLFLLSIIQHEYLIYTFLLWNCLKQVMHRFMQQHSYLSTVFQLIIKSKNDKLNRCPFYKWKF